jgi:hypothetical protein
MAIRVHLAASLLFATVTLSSQTTPAPTPNANNIQTPAQTLLGQGWQSVAPRRSTKDAGECSRLRLTFLNLGL